MKDQYKVTQKISNKAVFLLAALFISLLTRPDCLSQSDIIHTQYFHISSLRLLTNVFRPRGKKAVCFHGMKTGVFCSLAVDTSPQNRK